jgi:hypothetical protein
MPFETSTTLSSTETMRDSLEITFESLSKSDSVLWVCGLAPGTCEDHPNSPETISLPWNTIYRDRPLDTLALSRDSISSRALSSSSSGLILVGPLGKVVRLPMRPSCLISWSSLVWRQTIFEPPKIAQEDDEETCESRSEWLERSQSVVL